MSNFDQPLTRASSRRWRRRRYKDDDSFGKFAERTARFMGSPRFILYMTVFVIMWISANVILLALGPRFAWDPYPFILLNLAFSTQASYSAPLILLAQNRQDDRDRVQAQQDRQRAERTLADTEYLLREIAALRSALGEVATRSFVRSELRATVQEIDRDREERMSEREGRIQELQKELEVSRAHREAQAGGAETPVVHTGQVQDEINTGERS